MKTNLIKRIRTVAAAVAVTLAIGVGGAFAQGNVSATFRDGSLIWLKYDNAISCFGAQKWDQAKGSVARLKSGMCGLTDGSTDGQWRLPTKDELQHRAWSSDHGPGYYYWTSETYSGDWRYAFTVRMWDGVANPMGKSNRYNVWPVRSAQ